MSHRIVQLTDTHFLAPGDPAEGGFAYDTSEAFAAVVAHCDGASGADLVVVTGDLTDHGTPGQYRVAADALAGLAAPVNVCPGNHDQHAAFTAGVGRPTVSTSRVVRLGEWCHLFVDSNAGVMVETDTGHLVDPEVYEDRLHTNGALGRREADWVREQAEATDAANLFIWLHHPPSPSMPMCDDGPYAAEWGEVVEALPRLRGIGGGHTHTPDEHEFAGVPVFVGASLKNNFDLTARTVLPPGYRTYEFTDDGAVSSELHLLDDERWPRLPYGNTVHSLLMGEITWDEFRVAFRQERAGTS